MIAAQRRAHFRIWRLLAPLALIGFVIAIVARPARPVQAPVPSAPAPGPGTSRGGGGGGGGGVP